MSEQLSPFTIHMNERQFQRSLRQREISEPFTRKLSARQRIGRLALCGVLATGAVVSHAVENVMHNQLVAAEAVANIDIKSAALLPEDSTSSLLFTDGFGSYNSSILADSLDASVQQVIDGQVWSVDYGNALIDIDSIADKVVDTALEQSVDSMQLYGYSAGGDITLDLATAIQDRGIPISVIYLDSTPDGIEGLNPDRQQEVDEYATLMAKVPWLAYYDPARYVGEMALKADTFLAADSVFEAVTQFNKASEETHRLIDYEYTPGTWLLIDQLVAIEKTNGREKMQQLADNPTGVKPVIVYLGTGAPGVDTFVNDKRSGVAFCTYAAEASLPCYRYNIPGAIHMRPNLSVEAHTDVLQDAAPIIRAALDDE